MNTPEGNKNVSGSTDSNGGSNVQIDPSLLAEADEKAKAEAAAAAAAGQTVETPRVSDTVVDAAGNPGSSAAGTSAPTDKGGETGSDDDEPQIPVKGGKWLTNGLIAAAVLGVLALFGVAFVVVRNTASSPTTVVAPSAPVPAVPATPLSTLPEVRTPAPRLIDATRCTRGQYRLEGNQLVFTNCATLELAEPPAR